MWSDKFWKNNVFKYSSACTNLLVAEQWWVTATVCGNLEADYPGECSVHWMKSQYQLCASLRDWQQLDPRLKPVGGREGGRCICSVHGNNTFVSNQNRFNVFQFLKETAVIQGNTVCILKWSNTLGELVFAAADVTTLVFSSGTVENSDNMMLVFSGKHSFGTFPCVSNNQLLLVCWAKTS